MSPGPSTAPILAMLAVVLVTLGTYMGGYFWLGERTDWQAIPATSLSLQIAAHGRPETIERSFPHPWLATLFQPAGFVEEQFRGVDVQVVSRPGH